MVSVSAGTWRARRLHDQQLMTGAGAGWLTLGGGATLGARATRVRARKLSTSGAARNEGALRGSFVDHGHSGGQTFENR